MFNLRNKKKKGFTLIELIVVIAILGILAAVAIPRLGGFGESAENRAAESEHRILVSAIQIWQSNQTNPQSFPSALTDLDTYIDGGAAGLQYTHTLDTTNETLTTTHPNGGTDWVYTN